MKISGYIFVSIHLFICVWISLASRISLLCAYFDLNLSSGLSVVSIVNIT